jgi:competence protein ComEC
MKTEKIYRGHIPFVRFLVFFIAGIIGGYIFEPNLSIYWVLVLSSSICFLAFIALHFIDRWRVILFYPGVFFFLGMLALGWILLWNNDPNIQKSHFSHFETEALLGIVNEEPKYTGEYLRCELKVFAGIQKDKQISMTGLLLVNLKVDTLIDVLKYGDLIVIPSSYYEISPPYNPGDFNYKAYLANNNIWHSSFLENDQFKKIGEGKGNYSIQYAITFRQRMIRKFEQYLTDKGALSIASALVLGYRNDMEKEVLSVFTNTGTVHVLAVSGLHVGIVFVVFSALLFWMNRSPRLKFIKGVVLIVFI